MAIVSLLAGITYILNFLSNRYHRRQQEPNRDSSPNRTPFQTDEKQDIPTYYLNAPGIHLTEGSPMYENYQLRRMLGLLDNYP